MGRRLMAGENDSNRISSGSGDTSPGPFLAKVVGHLDSTYMGILEVELLRPSGNDNSEGQLRQVKYLSPFYGVTSSDFVTDTNDYNNTQKSYGFWAVPPDVGTIVLTIFVDGDPRRGYWMGCVPDENMNFMIPGLASTVNTVDADNVRRPVAEYNKKANDTNSAANSIAKSSHPFATVLTLQGLLSDDVRGITTSSARREVPSMVFGISTPGPTDKNAGAKKGAVGKKEHQIPNAFVSRLGGSTFVMDDGDDKFLRKTTADKGPPEYASVENEETDGNVNVPHNELIRLRTRTGHQILLHNSEDLIYIGNAKGTTWIELTSNGKIDIFANDSISVHTKADLNFLADRDINIEAGRNVNIKGANRVHAESPAEIHLVAGTNGFITTKKQLDLNSGTDTFITTGASLQEKVGTNYWNTVVGETHTWRGNGKTDFSNTPVGRTGAISGTQASSAQTISPLTTFSNQYNEVANNTVTSIMKRVPNIEPWAQHENLDPSIFSSIATDRENTSQIKIPTSYKQYSTKTDTFNPPPPPQEQK